VASASGRTVRIKTLAWGRGHPAREGLWCSRKAPRRHRAALTLSRWERVRVRVKPHEWAGAGRAKEAAPANMLAAGATGSCAASQCEHPPSRDQPDLPADALGIGTRLYE